MSDHYHYDYAYENHDHGGYASEHHDHSLDYADRHHRHYDDESTMQGLREDLGRAEERIRQLEDDLRDALNRIHVLEDYAGGETTLVDIPRVRPYVPPGGEWLP